MDPRQFVVKMRKFQITTIKNAFDVFGNDSNGMMHACLALKTLAKMIQAQFDDAEFNELVEETSTEIAEIFKDFLQSEERKSE